MYSKNNKKMNDQKQLEKVNQYGIKKFNVGTASVLVAAGFAFLGGGNALASNDTAVNNANEPASETAATTPAKEETPAPTVAKANKANLSAAIARVQNAIAKAGVTEKTASAIEEGKAELANAQALEASETATQGEVDKATVALKNRAFVLESMPKAKAEPKETSEAKPKEEVKEEKVNKNQDSRNGQAIPGQGESGFRDAAAATGYKNDINAVNTELKAEIDKVKVEITKEEALGEGKTNKEKLDMLRAIVAKAEEEKTKATTAAAKADATEQELQAALTEAKQEKDRLNYYLNNAENWGAPINNNRAGYGNNPANGVFESMSNGFGEVDFSGPAVESKSKTIGDQVNNLQSEKHYGKVTYNWKTKKITAAEAEAGALNGWKIGGTKDYVNAVKPEAPTDYTVAGDRTEAPKPAKAYDDNGKYDASTATQNQPNADGKFLGGAITLDGMKNDARGNVKERDYYLELGSKGVTLSKEYDVNPNSELFFNMVYNGAYGKAALSSQGEELSVEVTDAYTGKKIASIPMRDGSTPTEATGRPAGSNEGTPSDSWNNIARIYHIPEGTSKVKITIKAKEDGDFKGVQDGFIIGGVGVATGPGMQLTTNVTSEGKSGEYGLTKDKLYKRSQEGKLNLELKNVGGVENTFPYGGTFNIKVQIPKGVKLGTVNTTNYKKLDLSKAKGESIWTDQGYLTNVRYDEGTNTLSMDVNAVQYGKNNLKAAGETSRKFSIPFTTEDDYVGDATFKVTGTGGMGTQDAQGNRIYPWLWTGDKGPYAYDGNYKANGLRWTDVPGYYYNRTIYIDARTPKSATVEEVHTDSIVGDSNAKNQEKYLLVNTGDAPGSLTPSDDEIKANLKKVADNNGVTLSDEETAKRIAEIKKALQIENEIGKKIEITLPNDDIIELEKKDDGWYQGDTKVETTPEGKLKVSLKDVSLHTYEGNEKIAVTSVSPVGNVSEPSYANIVNEAPKVEAKKDIYVYKTDAANKWNTDKVLEAAKPTATDLEDDRDGDDTTKPTIAVSSDGGLDTTKVGDYTVKVQSTDSEGKKSTEAEVTVHVLDLITVDPTVTTDPTNPSTTAPVSPKTADTPVKPGDENLGKYPAGVTRDDLVKEVTRTIKYLKEEDANKDDATPLYAEKVQKVTYKRKATVNPQTGEVTYSNWEVYNEADKLTDATADGTKGKFNAVDSPVVENYLLVNATDKTVAAEDAPVPEENGTVNPVVKKVLYKEIGSFTLNYPEGKKPTNAPEKINYPNDPKDPSVPGNFGTVTIPHVDGFVPSYNGTPLTPVDPKDPTKGYKVPENFKPTDNFGKSPIEYAPGIQKATVKFVSVDKDGKETPLDEKFNINDLSGKAGEKIPENKIQARLDVLKSMGYEVNDNPFAKPDAEKPTFDTTSDTDTKISQNFVVKLTPKVSTPGTIYVVDGNKPEVEKVKAAVKTEGNQKTVDETKLPDTKDKAGQEVKVPVEVTYGTGDNTRKETVEVTAKVVKGNPQIIPVDQGQPLPENSVNTKDYPEGATFEYEKVDGKDPVNISEAGDYPVNVIVKDKDGNTLVKVPTTVRVVDSYRQYVPVNTDPKKVIPAENIVPTDFPDGTTFEYKTPVDTSTPGDKDVVVVAKLNNEPIAEIPAKVTVVGPKIQYVAVGNEPDVNKSVDPSVFPKEAEAKPEYKEKDISKTPGIKDVTVVVKDKDGDSIVEVPAKVVVAEGVEQLVPASEENKQPDAKDSVDPKLFPEGATFEYKTPVDTTKAGVNKVTVVVKDKNGNTLVEVPAVVKVAKPGSIETPITNDKFTPEDIAKNVEIPEGAKVTKVEGDNNLDLTTPGKKDPVKVTVELPNGKVITVEVPVNVTPVKPIETPVTSTPLTPEDYTKGIKIPEGGKVTNVENIPDLTTPGKKDPVKVTVELPNGKVITVEVPVTVTPINDIVKNVGDPITNEDVEKNVKIPEGGKIVSIGDKPGTDTPGVKPVVPVVIELPNGKQITVEVPVIVKPKVTPVVVPVGTPVTPEDVKKHIDLPEGWKITKVGEIPTTTTPGAKPSVTVEVELPDGRKITVEVPVIVTPKVSTIIVPQGTPITKDDVKNHIDLPKEPGWEIVEIGEIPSTIPAGVKPSVKVKVKLPNGKVIELEVPVISTPKVTPIEVEVGTPITKDDVKKHIELPKEPGWEIVEVGEIPTTETPGQKTAVKVKVKLPTGEIVELEVPVTVTPKATPAPRPTVKTTPIVVEVGTPITKEDVIKHVELPKGAEIVEVGEIPTTETAGQKASVKVKVKLPTGEIIEVEVPVTVTPKKETPALRPEKPSTPEVPATPEAPKAPVAKAGEKVLPNTGIADENSALAGLGLAILGLVGLRRRRKQK